jgi:hypothetical protein
MRQHYVFSEWNVTFPEFPQRCVIKMRHIVWQHVVWMEAIVYPEDGLANHSSNQFA